MSDEIPVTPMTRVRIRPRGHVLVSSSESNNEESDQEDARPKRADVSKTVPKRKKTSAAMSNADISVSGILEELKKTNAMMVGLVKKVERTERRIKAIEESQVSAQAPTRLQSG